MSNISKSLRLRLNSHWQTLYLTRLIIIWSEFCKENLRQLFNIYFADYGGNDAGGWQGDSLSLGGGGGDIGISGGGSHDWAGAASTYGLSSGGSGHGGGGSEGASIGGDFHHGVSIVSTGGGEHKGAVFDLTNQGMRYLIFIRNKLR